MPFAGRDLSAPFDLSRWPLFNACRDLEGPALNDLHGSLSWSELEKACLITASRYLRLGVQPGDRIASLMPNGLQLVVHYLAGLRCGVILTPLNYRYTVPEIDHALKLTQPSLILLHPERQEDIDCSLAPGLCRLGCITPDEIRVEDYFDDGSYDHHLLLKHRDSDEPCFLFLTSGSTGRPKAATHTLRSMGWMIASIQKAADIKEKQRILAGTSLSHIASTLLVIAALSRGAQVAIPNDLSSSSIEILLRRHRPTLVMALPVTLFNLVRDENLNCDDFNSVQLCISGGDKVNHQLHNEFTNVTGLKIDEAYGMSEIGFATLSPVDGENRLGSIGRLCPGFEGSIRDEKGLEISEGEEGLLWIRSPSNTIGYWDNDIATAETIQGEWLNTGDVMRVDSDGYLWFCGRRKQIIIHDGSNICPQDVEDTLMEHPSVNYAGVIGVEDAIHGQNVHAYVSLKPAAATPSENDLIAFARERVGYKAPEVIHYLTSIPLNSVGKIDRVALSRMAHSNID